MAVSESLAQLNLSKAIKDRKQPYSPESSHAEIVMEERIEVRHRRFIQVKKLARSGGTLGNRIVEIDEAPDQNKLSLISK